MTQRQVFSEIRLRTVALVFGRGEAVLGTDIALDVAPGRGLLLRGPNGAGKSTLLLTLAGLLPALGGRRELVGHDPEEGPAIHYCGHHNAVRPRFGVGETLRFWAAINGSPGIDVTPALNRVGLGHAERLDAGYLSAGQQRRLALARLLVSPRPVWLLDEPSAALDGDGEALLADLIGEHLAAGGLTVIATHDVIAVEGLDTLTLGSAP